jgi:dihydroorotate dehydrogenase electron transfer subunit
MNLPTIVPIRHIQVETERVRTFVLDLDLPQAEPGQFVMVWLPGVDEKPISIAHPAPLTLTVARVGPFSAALHRLERGERLGIRGPYGHGFSPLTDRAALLVGGGYGAAPLYFLASQALARSIPTVVALGARHAGDLIYLARFQELGLPPILATDDGSVGHHGPVTQVVAQMAEHGWEDSAFAGHPPALYACGPERMLVTLLRLCQDQGLVGQFSVERYMKCGFGICGQCALDGLLVCLDGPVLTVEQLSGRRDFGHSRRSATGERVAI